MDVKKQLRAGDRKISFYWDEDAGTWHVHGEPVSHRARNLEHARTMVRALAEAGMLPAPGAGTELPDARLDWRDADLRDWPAEELNVGGYVGTLKDMGPDEARVRIVRPDGTELAPLAVRARPDGDVELVVNA